MRLTELTPLASDVAWAKTWHETRGSLTKGITTKASSAALDVVQNATDGVGHDRIYAGGSSRTQDALDDTTNYVEAAMEDET